MMTLTVPHSLPRSPPLQLNPPRIVPSFHRFPLFRCSANLRASMNSQNWRVSVRLRAAHQPVAGKLEVERFASISSSNSQETSSVGVNPQFSVPPPPSMIGSPLFWIGVGVTFSALFSWAAASLKRPLYQYCAMGQVLDRLQGKQWRRKKIREITDKVFDHFKNETGRANLKFEDVYIGVLLVYNDINKRLPGPHFDPPSKDSVKVMIQENEINLDGEMDREEFAKLIKQITADAFVVVSQGLILTLVAAPMIAMATKRATEGVPHVGKVVQKIPTSVYASLLTLAVVLIQQALQEF